MAAHRYWRLVGFAVAGAGPLELSEVQLYAAGARVGATVVPSCPFAPASGTLADLNDGLATGVVSWPFAAHSSSGFALTWDLTGAGADVDGLRLGSGSGAGVFPTDLLLQWSDDANAWSTFVVANSIAYPGSYAMTAASTGSVDPTFGNVVLLLQADGADGSVSIVDSGPKSRSLTCFGGAKISTGHSRFGGSSMYLDGANATMIRCPTEDLEFRQNWSIAAWVYRISATAGTVLHIRGTQPVGAATGGQNGVHVHISANGALNVDNGVAGTTGSSAGVVPVGEWTFVEVVRSSNVTTGYVSTVPVLSHASQDTLSVLRAVVVGRFTQNDVNIQALPTFLGYIDDLRIKLGEAVRAASVPTISFGNNRILPSTPNPWAGFRQTFPLPAQWSGSVPINGAASSHLREYAFFDAYHGGLGIIYGTVKEKQTPANAPLRRKVWLMDERSGLVIRETWSDAATGGYEFRGIKQGTPYTVLAYDHAHNYRAFAGDNLLPDPMP